MEIVRADCLEWLPGKAFDCIFADPPDNIGGAYESYEDDMPPADYFDWLFRSLKTFLECSPIVWLSFNSRWTQRMGVLTDQLFDFPHLCGVKIKECVQVYTFGQHRQTDLGNNHRPLWRFMRPNAAIYPDNIRIPSWRQRHGDKRADKRGRVPGDVFDMQYPLDDLRGCIGRCSKGRLGYINDQIELPWGLTWVGIGLDDGTPWASRNPEIISTIHPGDVFDFPRVTGNSKQRCDWHPTQLHEDLVERCVLLSTQPGGAVCDPFAGTGTTGRVCIKHNRTCTLIDSDENYCAKMAEAFAQPAVDGRACQSLAEQVLSLSA